MLATAILAAAVLGLTGEQQAELDALIAARQAAREARLAAPPASQLETLQRAAIAEAYRRQFTPPYSFSMNR